MKFVRLFLFSLLISVQLLTGQNNAIINQTLNDKKELFEKQKVINEENLNEVKKNQLLLMFIIILVVFGLIMMIYYSKRVRITNKQLEFYSKENAFLLNEAHHRINNNLQIIISLISNELTKTENANNSSLQKILSKIESISTLHRHLYKSEEKKEVNIKNYLDEIVVNFSEICKEGNIEVVVKIDDKPIFSNDAMYFGLLVTELFINSIKHAFKDQQNKKIKLNLTFKTKKILLIYFDNGKTVQNNIVKPKLVINLAKQLKSDYSINTKDGFLFKLTKKLPHINE